MLGVQGDQSDVAALSTGRLVAADAAVVAIELETRTRGRVASVFATTAAEARRQTREWCARVRGRAETLTRAGTTCCF